MKQVGRDHWRRTRGISQKNDEDPTATRQGTNDFGDWRTRTRKNEKNTPDEMNGSGGDGKRRAKKLIPNCCFSRQREPRAARREDEEESRKEKKGRGKPSLGCKIRRKIKGSGRVSVVRRSFPTRSRSASDSGEPSFARSFLPYFRRGRLCLQPTFVISRFSLLPPPKRRRRKRRRTGYSTVGAALWVGGWLTLEEIRVEPRVQASQKGSPERSPGIVIDICEKDF